MTLLAKLVSEDQLDDRAAAQDAYARLRVKIAKNHADMAEERFAPIRAALEKAVADNDEFAARRALLTLYGAQEVLDWLDQPATPATVVKAFSNNDPNRVLRDAYNGEWRG